MSLTVDRPNSNAAILRQLGELRQERAEQRKSTARLREAAAVDMNDETVMQAAKSKNLEDELTYRIQDLEAQATGRLGSMGNGTNLGGDAFISDPEKIAQLEAMANSSQPREIDLGQIWSRDELSAILRPRAGTGSSDLSGLQGLREHYGPVVPALSRPLQLLNFIQTGTMDGDLYKFIVTGRTSIQAATVAEGAVKPQATGITYDEVTIPARTIALWIKTPKQTSADIPEFTGMLTVELTYQVQNYLESQILAGDGVGQNLVGILNTAGIGVVGPNAGIPATDQVLKGKTMVQLSNASANAVVLHPQTWEDMLTHKATGSGERLDASGAFNTDGTILWGMSVISSPVVDPAVALVGDWNLGVRLMIREGVTCLTGLDSDDFTRNIQTTLCETRCALPVFHPSAFAEVQLAP